MNNGILGANPTITNPTGVLYIWEDKLRMIKSDDPANRGVVIQYKDPDTGEWLGGDLKLASESLKLGEVLSLGDMGGDFYADLSTDDAIRFIPTIKFDNAGSIRPIHDWRPAPITYTLFTPAATIPDSDTTYQFDLKDLYAYHKNIYFKFGNNVATNFRMKIYEDPLVEGKELYNLKLIPTTPLSPNAINKFTFEDSVGIVIDPAYAKIVVFESDTIFDTFIDGTGEIWHATDNQEVFKQSILSNPAWSEKTWSKNDWIFENDKIYTCLEDGAQTGTFQDNIAKWTILGGTDYSRYLGIFADLTALQTAYPTGILGDTATVTSPSGNIFFWDGDSWEDSGTGSIGNMLKSVYDPQAKNADAFARANHTGQQPASSISDFATAVASDVTVATNSAKVTFPEAPIDTKQYSRKDGTWTETNILQSDWNQADTEAEDFIKNKPEVGVPKVYYAEDLTESSNGTTTFVTKVSLSLPAGFEAGDYFIEVNYGWQLQSTSYDFESQVMIDSTPLGTHNHRQESADSDSNQRHAHFRRFKKTLTAGVHTVFLKYRASYNDSASAKIHDASIAVTKIAIQ